jgi:hypothetical protein
MEGGSVIRQLEEDTNGAAHGTKLKKPRMDDGIHSGFEMK